MKCEKCGLDNEVEAQRVESEKKRDEMFARMDSNIQKMITALSAIATKFGLSKLIPR